MICTQRKKLMAFVITLAMMISIIPAISPPARAADITPSTSLKGSGTEEDPFLIESAEDLAYMRNMVNSGDVISTSGAAVVASTAYYVLTTDIIIGYWRDNDNDGIVDDGEIYDSEDGGRRYSGI